MQYSFKNLAVLLVIFFSALVSCRENTIINSKVAPASDSIGVYSTSLNCITHTYFDDTSITNLYLGLAVLQGVGASEDPFFGTMTGSTFFQVLPTRPTNAIYSNATIDSAVLILPYTGISYGDTTDPTQSQTYQVFYVTDTMSTSSSGTTYYSFSNKTVDAANPLSAPTTVSLYHLKDSLSVNGVKYHPGLRIPLNVNALNSHLLPALDVVTNSSNQTPDFLNAFRGVCVRVSDSTHTNKSFPYFQLDGNTDYTGAGIIVYFHTNGGNDTLQERYYFNPTYCGYFNKISKGFASYPVNQLLTSTQPNDSIIALQNQPGPNLDIMIPGLKSLPTGLINKAELQIPVLSGSYNPDAYALPARLYPQGVGNGRYPTGIVAGLTYNVADRYPLNSTSPFLILDGRVQPITTNGVTVNTFTIGLPREVIESIRAGNDTLHLHITGTQDFYGAYHLVAGGGGNANPLYRPKLFVVYSKLN